eukprot:29249-Pelagococcus_subviridis.AAC.3
MRVVLTRCDVKPVFRRDDIFKLSTRTAVLVVFVSHWRPYETNARSPLASWRPNNLSETRRRLVVVVVRGASLAIARASSRLRSCTRAPHPPRASSARADDAR